MTVRALLLLALLAFASGWMLSQAFARPKTLDLPSSFTSRERPMRPEPLPPSPPVVEEPRR